MARKKKWFLLLALACVLVLAACGSKEDPGLPPEPEDGVLIYAALNPVDSRVQSYINKFNVTHTDVQIEVRDYSDENGPQRLMTELVLGRVPDIIELCQSGEKLNKFDYYYEVSGGYWMPYRQMVLRGYLEDLWPYIENDPDLGPDGVLNTPLKAAEVNGGLYMLFGDVSISTLAGSKSVIGERTGWTLEELMDSLRSMPMDSTILRYTTTRYEMFTKIYSSMLDHYIDWETGETSFDSEEFRSILEFLKTFPEEFETNLSNNDIEWEIVDRIYHGQQMVEVVELTGASSLSAIRSAIFSFFPEGISLVGYPTSDGSSGSFFHLQGSVWGMSSTCQDKEAAWEFMRQLLKAYNEAAIFRMLNSSDPYSLAIPVNTNNYELTNSLAPKLNASTGNIYYFAVTRTGELIPRFPPTEEDIAVFKELVENTSQIYWPDSSLSEIVWEACGPYFAGDRTIDDTIRMIENRVRLYVNEQR